MPTIFPAGTQEPVEGEDLTLTCSTTGSGPLKFQWQKVMLLVVVPSRVARRLWGKGGLYSTIMEGKVVVGGAGMQDGWGSLPFCERWEEVVSWKRRGKETKFSGGKE